MKIALSDLCLPNAGQVKLEPDTLVDYFDISSVDNISKTVTDYETYPFAEAPSRARKAVRKNSILVSTVRPNLNAVALFQTETDNIPVVSTGFCVLDCKESVNPRFVFNFCRSKAFIEDMVSQATGASYPAVSDKIVRAAKIPQYSLEQQNEITQTLDSVSSIIEARKQQLQKLDELVKARFVEMFGNPEFNEKSWKTCRLGDECRVINGRAYKAEELLDDGKYRVLRVGNFFTNDNWYFSDLELDDDKYCDEGDLLFAWSASFGPRIWHGEKVIYHYHIWKLADYEHCLNKDFFVELLNYNCEVMKQGTHGSTMLHFTKSQMEDQQLILPPMELQKQFADLVGQTDRAKAAIRKTIDKAQFLFDSLMQKYFG